MFLLKKRFDSDFIIVVSCEIDSGKERMVKESIGSYDVF